jgi:hypothetical protein
MKPFALDRRTLLRAAGASIALPTLEAMLTGSAGLIRTARGAEKPPLRIVTFFIPCGVVPATYFPTAEGTGWATPESLKPLETAGVKDDVNLLNGLRNNESGIGNNHARGTVMFANGMPSLKTGAGGPTLEWVVAQRRNEAGMVLSVCPVKARGNAAASSSSLHCTTISWKAASVPFPAVRDVGQLFNQLFGRFTPPAAPGAGPDPAAQARTMRDLSVLDFVRDQIAGLNMRLGASDRQRLDQHLTELRNLEVRIKEVQTVSANCTKPSAPPASMTTPDELTSPTTPARTDVMSELVVKALQCDIVRYVAFQLENGQSFADLPWLGLTTSGSFAGQHQFAHQSVGSASDLPGAIARYTKIVSYEIERFAHLLQRMKNAREGAQNVLDNSVVYLGSEHGTGNHGTSPMPVILAGKAGGRLATGRHIKFPAGTPINNMHLSILHLAGLPDATFANDSTGVLTQLLSA